MSYKNTSRFFFIHVDTHATKCLANVALSTNETAFIKHNKKEQLKMHPYIIPPQEM